MDMSRYASEWLDAKNVSNDIQNPTVATIIDEGVEVTNKFGKRVAFTIDVDGTEYKYTPSKTAIRVIMKQHGQDSMQYPGKKIKLLAVPTVIRGEMKQAVLVI